jgi:hypothetical protein
VTTLKYTYDTHDWILTQGDPNEFDVVNKKYMSDFLKYYAMPIGLLEFETNDGASHYLQKFMKENGKHLLQDAETLGGATLMGVGFDLLTSKRSNDRFIDENVDSYDFIPRSEWIKPIYGNPGFINTATGQADPIWFPTNDGKVGIIIYFQYIPKGVM